MPESIVTLKKGEGREFGQGGLWIYDNEIDTIVGTFKNGDIVAVHAFNGYMLGRGYINQNSKIRIRMMTRNAEQLIDDEFIYNSGVCLYRMGEMEEAEKEFRLTLQKNPEHASAHHYLMEIYSRKYQQTEDIQYYKSALEEINAQLELVPDAYYYIERGLLYMDHYEFEPAIADYKKALELEPDNLYAYNNIGYALRIQGRYEDCLCCNDYSETISFKVGRFD